VLPIVKNHVTTVSRSPLGLFIALLLVTTFLLLVGLHLATAGSFFDKIKAALGNVQPPKTALDALSDQIKKFERPQVLAMYGALILAGAGVVTFLGCFIRTYRFRFMPRARCLERQALWLYIPSWALLGLPLLLLVMGLLRPLAAPLLKAPLGTWLFPALWLALSIGVTAGLLVTLRYLLARYLDFSLFIPGGRKRIPFSQVNRIEIRQTGEGPTVLALTLKGAAVGVQRTWIVSRGSPKRLQRLGSVLSRILGLERRDLVTWS
jgi:hypothetical protein